MKEFFAEIQRGQTLARERLLANPMDDETLFFLGKLDLNYVWLQLGPLKRKTGWDEYWEARKSLDALLARNPGHVRARVARAWIDYIVDTKMPWGTRWVLGGGNKKKALTNIREAARVDADYFTHAEAEFALWDMQVRERDMSNGHRAAARQGFPGKPRARHLPCGSRRPALSECVGLRVDGRRRAHVAQPANARVSNRWFTAKCGT